MKLAYPTCFYLENDGRYSVDVPDLLGCVTFGDDLPHAIEMATDAASGWILSSLESGETIPSPSKLEEIKLDDEIGEEGFVNYIMLDMESYAEKHGDKAIRKNLTIPAWLNTFAEKQNINFSKVLQDALVDKLDIAQ